MSDTREPKKKKKIGYNKIVLNLLIIIDLLVLFIIYIFGTREQNRLIWYTVTHPYDEVSIRLFWFMRKIFIGRGDKSNKANKDDSK